MNFTDLRLRFGRFMKNNRKILLIVILIWIVVIMINNWIKNRPTSTIPETSYEAHTSIMTSSATVPKSLQVDYEELIAKYVDYCNKGEFDLAFKMLSEDCRENAFDNNVENFMLYLVDVMPTAKEYSIQNYSNTTLNGKKAYIYQVKYFDDILATGLSDKDYSYTEEKIVFTLSEKNKIDMSVGNFLYYTDIKRITENEYLKVDVKNKKVYYSIEEYTINIMNRSEYTIIVADGTEKDEISLGLNQEKRSCIESPTVVLKPGESIELKTSFYKFADDGDTSNQLALSNIRVMEKYSGTQDIPIEVIEQEKNNAIAKFGLTVSLQ